MADAPEDRRRRPKRGYTEAHLALRDLLFEEDPIRINFGCNTDEYDPEVETIMPRLRDCRSPDDVLAVVHEEFVRWFGAADAGSSERYARIAERVWAEIRPQLEPPPP